MNLNFMNNKIDNFVEKLNQSNPDLIKKYTNSNGTLRLYDLLSNLYGFNKEES